MNIKIAELLADPFGERTAVGMHRDMHLLGARVRFESNSEDLLRLVDSAYAGLPRHRLSRVVPQLRVRLMLTSSERKRKGARAEPAPLQMMSGAGLIGAATGSSTFMVVSPEDRGALIAVAPGMLRFPYHTRYELIEFAVFTLASRVQGLVPLHGACVGRAGRGVLLLGATGAGKSTVTLQCLLEGLGLLAEDSVFVVPDTLLATGVGNFLHVRADSLRWIAQRSRATRIRKSPVIVRRSGVRKYEIDLRGDEYQLAERPLKLGAIVFLSSQRAMDGHLLKRLSQAEALSRLVQEQAYAASQPPWTLFTRSVARLPFFELRRGQHPSEAVAVLRELIDSPSRASR
ncbi:MAG: serine kinase of the HPr protein regulates carbohydrate metabolism [Gammaproteobacteria bacterium]|nr:serine kinase of the HPr protein regulates carbohydrate metabolism [Gammaproteobacteria bacterium]